MAISFGPGVPLTISNANTPNAVAGADLDGDDDIDLVVVSPNDDTVGWYENLGDGGFGPQRVVSDTAIGVGAVRIADLNGDGHLDLITGGASRYDSDVSWFANDGQGNFGEQQFISAEVEFTEDVLAIDVDDDGDLDVVSASRADDKVAWYENLDGEGSFGGQNIITDNADGARTLAAADLDGDLDLDLVVGSVYDNSIRWFANLGNGEFSDETQLTGTAEYVTSVIAEDLDGDGQIDIVFTSRDDHSVGWFRNAGNGSFGPERLIALDSLEPYAVLVDDFDDDGLADVAVADYLRDEVVWYPNLGDNVFDERVQVGDSNGPVALFAGDLDADGKPDLVSTSRRDNRVTYYRNVEAGEFEEVQRLTEPGYPSAQYVSTGDVDGDGDLDVVSASYTTDSVGWFENLDGLGTFGPERRISDRANGAETVLLADVDGDEDLDAISASYLDDKIAWYENLDGLGNFGPQRLISGDASGPELIVVADIDQDGLPDIVSASRGDGELAWYRNSGDAGVFEPQIVVFESESAMTYVDVADIDGDGDLDLIANEYNTLASGLASVIWLENVDGEGTFDDPVVITRDVDIPIEITPVDLDQDLDLDLVVTSANDDRLIWIENLGSGRFSSQTRLISDEFDAPFTVRGADLDGDGDADLVVGALFDDQLLWFENLNGLGDFGAGEILSTDSDSPNRVHTADIDGDGDQDVVASISGGDQILWFRNLAAATSLPGDFNESGVVDVDDIDALCAEIRAGGLDRSFDLNADGSVNAGDMNELVTNILGTSAGDANLDGVFSSSDFIIVFQVGEYEDAIAGNSTWAEGDWNCDGEFATSDLVYAFQVGNYVTSAAPTLSIQSTSDLSAAWAAARDADDGAKHGRNRSAFVA